MSDDPKYDPKIVTSDLTGSPEWSASVAVDQQVSAESGSQWWKEFKQESYLFGFILLIVGLLLIIFCNSFIRGVAGNVFAAGVVFVLFSLFKTLTEWMKKSPNRTIGRLTKRLGLRRDAW